MSRLEIFKCSISLRCLTQFQVQDLKEQFGFEDRVVAGSVLGRMAEAEFDKRHYRLYLRETPMDFFVLDIDPMKFDKKENSWVYDHNGEISYEELKTILDYIFKE